LNSSDAQKEVIDKVHHMTTTAAFGLVATLTWNSAIQEKYSSD
jgi:hypothetical protein